MIKIFCYHKISDIRNDYNGMNVTRLNFRKQMQYLSQNYKAIKLDEITLKLLSDDKENYFAVTFDDGYRNVLQNALPILEEYQIPATVFVTTGNIDTFRENWMDNILRAIFQPDCYKDYFEWENEGIVGKWYTKNLEERVSFYKKINLFFRRISAAKRLKYEKILLNWADLSDIGCDENQILSSEELKILSKNSLITIGAHSVTHPSLGNISIREQEIEISQSIDRLRKITGNPIRLFAYPFGGECDYTNDTITILRKYGIKMAFSTAKFEEIGEKTDFYRMPRCVMNNYSEEDFKLFIQNKIFNSDRKARNPINLITPLENNTTYVGCLENDLKLFKEKLGIVIWGCGYWGENLYNDLIVYGMKDRILAFGDNDKKKIGEKKHGLPIWGKERVFKETEKQSVIILVKNSHDLEIVADLFNNGIKDVHLIER